MIDKTGKLNSPAESRWVRRRWTEPPTNSKESLCNVAGRSDKNSEDAFRKCRAKF